MRRNTINRLRFHRAGIIALIVASIPVLFHETATFRVRWFSWSGPLYKEGKREIIELTLWPLSGSILSSIGLFQFLHWFFHIPRSPETISFKQFYPGQFKKLKRIKLNRKAKLVACCRAQFPDVFH